MRVVFSESISGGSYSPVELLQRAKDLGVVAATNLLPENLLAACQIEELRTAVCTHFSQPREVQRDALMDCVEAASQMPTELHNAFLAVDRGAMLGLGNDPLAYWNGVNVVRGSNGAPSPWLVRYMVEALEIEVGSTVAILGFGTGYTTAILSHMVGSSGRVLAVELDPKVCDEAEGFLRQNGFLNVGLICQNALSLALPVPVDAICATLSARKIPESWGSALTSGGRIGCFLPMDHPNGQVSLYENLHYGIWCRSQNELICVSTMPSLINSSFEAGLSSEQHLDQCISEHQRLTQFITRPQSDQGTPRRETGLNSC